MERIGIAISHSYKGRKLEYGIYAMTEAYGYPVDPPRLYLKYEGCREQREDGEALVGLSLAGPNAAHLQPLCVFHPDGWETIRYFKDGPWNTQAK